MYIYLKTDMLPAKEYLYDSLPSQVNLHTISRSVKFCPRCTKEENFLSIIFITTQ